MKAKKKGGASAPKDKSMEYKNGLAKKYAGEEAAKLTLYESQIDFITGKKARPRTGAGTYAMHSKHMRKYAHMKTEAERRGEIVSPTITISTVIEKTVYLVYPLTKESHLYRTKEGAENQLNKKYDKWIMSEISCNYEDICIKPMTESQAISILEKRGCTLFM